MAGQSSGPIKFISVFSTMDLMRSDHLIRLIRLIRLDFIVLLDIVSCVLNLYFKTAASQLPRHFCVSVCVRRPDSQRTIGQEVGKMMMDFQEFLLMSANKCVTYLLQPKNGGMAQPTPMNQAKPTPASACVLPNLKAPNGLQMTRYLSKDKMAKDQAVTSPEEEGSWFKSTDS